MVQARDSLGHHVLLDEIGRGSMGVVYAAYDAKLDRKVAIKLMHTREREASQRRMVREAQALARISHPNVVQVYEIGEYAGQAYLVMEFVEGMTLRAWLSASPRSRREILATFAAAGRGLEAAHQEGLVHRDFKPDNVMVRRDARVLVMDFGLAREPEDDEQHAARGPTPHASLEQTVTQADTLLGTPAYMAPEQFAGLPLDARTDQFAFCVALWEALFGARPFAGSSLATLSEAVCEGRISAPERSEVPSWLRRVLERGLAPDPDERWPSIAALLDALARDPSRRRRGWLLGGATLGLAALGMIAVDGWQTRATKAAQRECERLGEAIALDWNDEVARSLERAFVASEAVHAEEAWSHTRPWLDEYAQAWSSLRTQTCVETELDRTRTRDSHDTIVACLDQRRASFVGLLAAWSDPEQQPLVPARVLAATLAASSLPSLTVCGDERSAARVQPPAELREQVERLRAKLDRLAGRSLAGDHELALAEGLPLQRDADALGWLPLQAEVELLLGRTYVSVGKYDEAERTLQRAFMSGLAANDDVTCLEAAIQLTHVNGYLLAKPEVGALWGEIGERLLERLGQAGTLREAALRGAIAGLAAVRADFPAALRGFERAVELRQALLGPDHPSVGNSINSIGVVYIQMGKYDEANDAIRRALTLAEATLGPDHPDLANALNNYAALLGLQGRNAAALEIHHRALALRLAARGPDHPHVASSLANIGVLVGLLGDLELAELHQRHAIAIFEAAYGPDHPELVNTRIELADTLARRDGAAALEQLRLALASFTATRPDDAAAIDPVRERIADLEARAADSTER